MSAGFGWSLGDVILLAKTTHKITAALRQNGAASSEFQKTFRSFESLRLTLTEIKTILVNTDSRFRNAIRAQVDDSSSSIAAFNDTLQKKYGRALSSTAPKGPLSGAWRKARWALLAAEDIAAFQAELSGQLEIVKMLMAMQLCTALKGVEDTVTANRDLVAAAAIENKTQADEVILEVYRAHKDLKSSLSSLESVITTHPGLLQQTRPNQEASHRIETQMTNLHHDLKIPSSDLNTSALARHELVLSVVMEQESQMRKIGQNNVDVRDDLKSLLDRVGGSQKANLMEPGTLLDGLTDIMLSVQSLKLQQDDQVRQAQSQQAEHNMELMQAIQALGTILLNPQSSQSVCLNSRTRPAIRAQGTVRHLSFREGMRLGQLLASCLWVLCTMLRELFNKYICLSPHLYLLFRTVSQFLPRPRSLLLGDTIQFEDVLGTVRILPFAYFQHFDVFEAFLRNDFKDKPGRFRVLSRRYHVLCAQLSDTMMTRDNWTMRVRPGVKILMSMIMDNVFIDFNTCPMCKKPLRNTSLTGASYCQHCDQNFHLERSADPQVVPVSRVEEIDLLDDRTPNLDPLSPAAAPEDVNHEPLYREHGNLRQNVVSEMSYFKHMHLGTYVYYPEQGSAPTEEGTDDNFFDAEETRIENPVEDASAELEQLPVVQSDALNSGLRSSQSAEDRSDHGPGRAHQSKILDLWYCGWCSQVRMSLGVEYRCWNCQRPRDGYALSESKYGFQPSAPVTESASQNAPSSEIPKSTMTSYEHTQPPSVTSSLPPQLAAGHQRLPHLHKYDMPQMQQKL